MKHLSLCQLCGSLRTLRYSFNFRISEAMTFTLFDNLAAQQAAKLYRKERKEPQRSQGKSY